MDLMNCCRICIQGNDTMRSINELDICGKMKIVDKINICAKITSKNHNNIPEKICLKCLEDLHIAYRFKMNCETAETILKSIYEGQVITDLIMSSDNGEIFKYEPPRGLRVKRIIKGQIENQLQEITTIKSEIDLSVGDDNRGNNVDDINDEDETLFLNTHDYDDSNFIEEEDEHEENDNDEHLSNEEYINVPQQMKIEYLDNDQDLSQDFPQETIMEYNNQSSKDEKVEPKEEDSVISSSKSNKERKVKHKVNKNDSGKANDFRVRKPLSDDLKTIKICDICGNTYKYKHALESHMRRHRNEKPFSCEICGRSFVINFELRRHMRTHTGQKPYACQFCDRRFSDFGSRIKHERTHTGERPYTCETCGKSFAYSHVLSSHVLIHTGEKRFGCDECGKRFTKSHHLKAHKNTHYKPEKKWMEPCTTTYLIDPTVVDKSEIVMSQTDDIITVLTTEGNETKPTTTMFLDSDGKVLSSDIKIIYN